MNYNLTIINNPHTNTNNNNNNHNYTNLNNYLINNQNSHNNTTDSSNINPNINIHIDPSPHNPRFAYLQSSAHLQNSINNIPIMTLNVRGINNYQKFSEIIDE